MAAGEAWWSTIAVVPASSASTAPSSADQRTQIEVERQVEPPPDLVEDLGEVRRRAGRRRHPPGERRVEVVVRADQPGRGGAHEPFRAIGSDARHSPSRCAQGTRHGAGRGNQADLADALDPVRRPGLGPLDQDHVDGRHVLGPQDAELAQGHGRGSGLVVGGEVLGEGVAEAHVDGADHLALAQQRVHRPADVVGGDDPLDVAGVAVHDDELGGVAERRVDRRLLDRRRGPAVQSTRYSPS